MAVLSRSYSRRGSRMRNRGRSKSKKRSRTKRVLVDTQALRQLQVYRYPFSVITTNPKIPDGKVTQSIGIRYNSVYDFTGKDMLVILSPTFGVHGFRYDGTTVHKNSWNNFPAGTIEYIGGQAADPNAVPPVPFKAPTAGKLTFDGRMGQWRVVSAGLRLKCISSDDKNDGYFEAIRISPANCNDIFFPKIVKTDPTDTQGGSALVNSTFIVSNFTKTNWLSNPTYQSGNVKNLSQYEFRLQPQVEEHDFVQVPTELEYMLNEYGVNGWPLYNDGKEPSKTFDFVRDPGFDIICIRISGIAATQMLCHYSHNIEYIPTSSNYESIFQTESVDASSGLKRRQLEYKREERLPGKYIGGPRNS